MSIASTRDTKFVVNAFVLLALKRAGLANAAQTQTDASLAGLLGLGRDLLQTIMSHEGIRALARHVVPYELSLTAGTQSYTLDEEIIDIIEDGAYIAADEADTTAASGETIVKQINSYAWQGLSDKASEGTPTMFYAERGGDDFAITVYLYQRPSEAGTIRFRVHKAPADSTSAGDMIDMESGYNQYLLHELAGQLLESSQGDAARVGSLFSRAQVFLAEARDYGAEHIGPVVELDVNEAQRR